VDIETVFSDDAETNLFVIECLVGIYFSNLKDVVAFVSGWKAQLK